MRKRRSGRGGAGKIVRRTVALFLAGVTGWMLWLTADLSAAGDALKALGDNVRLTAALLTAELGRVAEVRDYRLGTRAELELTEQPAPGGQPRLTPLP